MSNSNFLLSFSHCPLPFLPRNFKILHFRSQAGLDKMNGCGLSLLEEQPYSQVLLCFNHFYWEAATGCAWAGDVKLWKDIGAKQTSQIRNQRLQSPWWKEGTASILKWVVSIWHENQKWESKFCWNSSQALHRPQPGTWKRDLFLDESPHGDSACSCHSVIPGLIFGGIWAPLRSPDES